MTIFHGASNDDAPLPTGRVLRFVGAALEFALVPALIALLLCGAA